MGYSEISNRSEAGMRGYQPVTFDLQNHGKVAGILVEHDIDRNDQNSTGPVFFKLPSKTPDKRFKKEGVALFASHGELICPHGKAVTVDREHCIGIEERNQKNTSNITKCDGPFTVKTSSERYGGYTIIRPCVSQQDLSNNIYRDHNVPLPQTPNITVDNIIKELEKSENGDAGRRPVIKPD